MAKRKTYSTSFKSKVALEAIKGDMTLAELASKYGVNPNMITRWKKRAIDGMSDTFSKRGQANRDVTHEARIKELHAKIGELTIERDFLAKAFGGSVLNFVYGAICEILNVFSEGKAQWRSMTSYWTS